MAIELRQQLRLTQQLVMTPQLQQAIKLLQLSRQELVEEVSRELVENPVLEEVSEGDEEPSSKDAEASDADLPGDQAEAQGEPEQSSNDEDGAIAVDAEGAADSLASADSADAAVSSTDEMVADVDWDSYMESRPQTSLGRPDDDRPSLEDNLTAGESLADHLLWQLGFSEMSSLEKRVATLCIGNLNADGFLEEKIELIAEAAGTEPDLAEKVLLRLQRFDPVGVGARTLSECLLIQIEVAEIEDPLLRRLARDHLERLKRKDYAGISRLEDTTIGEVARAARDLATLEPRPGRAFAEEEPIYITPDIFVLRIGDEYHVVLNEDGLPRLRVSNAYRQVLQRRDDDGDGSKETRAYVRGKLRSAVWLIKSIQQRQRTIVRVMESILRFQREFFDSGVEHLRPLNLRDVADDIGMHESTVSRVTTAKYVQTPHGLYELKFFFNSSIQTGSGDSIASESVKAKIRGIISAEDASRPLSDQKISEILRTRDISIARRTVTKYREALRILSSTLRREIG